MDASKLLTGNTFGKELNGISPFSGVKSLDLSRAPSLIHLRCNIFGEEIRGAQRVLGGMANPKNEKHQWICKNLSEGRFRMECEHGHVGQIMQLCKVHLTEFRGGKVQFCPACNTKSDHRCSLTIKGVS